MGSSVVSFRGKGFWCRDGALEFWLYILVEEVKRLNFSEPWLEKLSNHWYEQSQFGGSGCINAGLNDLMTSDQVNQAIILNQKAMTTLLTFGEFVPLKYLNDTCAPGNYYTGEVPTRLYLQVGEHFEALLNGTLIVDTNFGIYGNVIPYPDPE